MLTRKQRERALQSSPVKVARDTLETILFNASTHLLYPLYSFFLVAFLFYSMKQTEDEMSCYFNKRKSLVHLSFSSSKGS
jgi:hypothetical protein